MVIAAFFIASLVVIVALGAFQGAKKGQDEVARKALERDARTFLSEVTAPDRDHVSGCYGDLTVHITTGNHEVDYAVQLVPALVPYTRLIADFAGPRLLGQLRQLQLEITADDVMRGSVPREPGLAETLVTIEKRLGVALAIGALRRHAPSILLAQLKRAHQSSEVDEVLLALATTFPTAPETEAAITYAAHREHTNPDRIRERAANWLSAGRMPDVPIR